MSLLKLLGMGKNQKKEKSKCAKLSQKVRIMSLSFGRKCRFL